MSALLHKRRSSEVNPPRTIFDALAPLRVRAKVSMCLQEKERAAFAVATTSSKHGRGVARDRILVEASYGAASACSGSWLWEVVPRSSELWRGRKAWNGDVAKQVAWTKMSDRQWRGRWEHSMVAVPNSDASAGYTLLVAGGMVNEDEMFGDLYASNDGGITWRVLYRCAPFNWRAGHAMVVVPRPNGAGCITVLVGGRNNRVFYEDVWWSRDVGVTWEKATKKAECSTRTCHAMCVLPGDPAEILLVGGFTHRGRAWDSWISSDMGRSWDCVCEEGEWGRSYFPGLVAVPDPKCPGKCRVLHFCQIAFSAQVWESVDRGRTWQRVLRSSPFRGNCMFYSNPVSVAPRVGGGGDVVLVLGGGLSRSEVWVCKGGEGVKWEKVEVDGEDELDSRFFGPAMVVVPSCDGDGVWEVITTGGTTGGAKSDVWRGRLHA